MQAYAIVVSFALLVVAVHGQERQPVSENQVREWIEQLANKSEPVRHTGPWHRLSKEERDSLERVKEAFRQLTRNFRESLPLLVDHLNDKRYSYPREHPTSGVFENQSVGDACHTIIQGKILLRGLSFIDSRDIGVWVDLPIDQDWYKDISKMTLYEMQVDAIDRLLKQPKLERVTAEQWEEGLAKVRRFREEFVQKGIPVDRVFEPPIDGK